ncbi:unnamed protein product [Arctia plantaginis]|uniref:Uncharacterized protein n=1 Tax=Arctia plantaginis TaxID=874455 RepID=A0A8S0YT75_ARCPL|nr:unnamed protein product [Arctia plantaginis]
MQSEILRRYLRVVCKEPVPSWVQAAGTGAAPAERCEHACGVGRAPVPPQTLSGTVVVQVQVQGAGGGRRARGEAGAARSKRAAPRQPRAPRTAALRRRRAIDARPRPPAQHTTHHSYVCIS